MYHIEPERLQSLRRKRNLSRARLAKLSGVSERTIQRLESSRQGDVTPRKVTLDRLAKAFQVEPKVLSGELLPPQSDKVPAKDLERVQVGALIAPKTRLAYDLVKRRYGVSATEIINVAPLLFVLLAEGSLAKRRERLREAEESIDRLDRTGLEANCDLFSMATTVAYNAVALEEESIAKADIFGEYLFSSNAGTSVPDEPFDPATNNPFADCLRQLTRELANRGVVDTTDDLNYGSPYGKLPGYDICSDELDGVANGSTIARKALELGYVRLSEIPGELLAEEAGEKRAAWLEERLPSFFKELEENEPTSRITEFLATATPDEVEVVRVELGFQDHCGPEQEGDGK